MSEEWTANEVGACPGWLASKPNARIYVRLRNGREPKESWPADPKRGTYWAHRYRGRYPFDIVAWRLA